MFCPIFANRIRFPTSYHNKARKGRRYKAYAPASVGAFFVSELLIDVTWDTSPTTGQSMVA